TRKASQSLSRRRLCRYHDPNRTRKMVVGRWWWRLSSGCLDEASTSRRVHTTKGARRRSKVECLSRRGSHCHDGTRRRLRGYHRVWADIGRTGKHLEGLRLNDADKEFLARAQEYLAQTADLEVKDELTGIWTDLKTRAVKAAREGRKRAAQEDDHEVQTLKHARVDGARSRSPASSMFAPFGRCADVDGRQSIHSFRTSNLNKLIQRECCFPRVAHVRPQTPAICVQNDQMPAAAPLLRSPAL
ncbi:unnamed protein product, partial [Ascophyllum nodosum]